MTRNLKLFLATLFTSTLVLATAIPALAQNTQGTTFGQDMASQLEHAGGSAGANLGEPIDPRATVIFIIRAFLSVVGLILLFLYIYAGFTWGTAAGNEEKVESAKKTIRNATIGLIIVLGAYSLTIFAANLARGYVFSTPGFSPFTK